MGPDGVRRLESETGQAGKGDDVGAELAPFGGCAVAFLSPMDVEGTDEGGALAAVVVEGEKLETCVTGCAEVSLDFVLISQHLQSSTGHEELLGLRCHAIGGKEIAENLEVVGFVGFRVLRDFLEVREGTPLALLVGEKDAGESPHFLIIPWLCYLLGIGVVATGLSLVPFQTTSTAFDVVLRAVVPFPSSTDRGGAVDT